jgi:hypothetical protein
LCGCPAAVHIRKAGVAALVSPAHAVQPNIVTGDTGQVDSAIGARRARALNRHRRLDKVDGTRAATLSLFGLGACRNAGGIIDAAAAKGRKARQRIGHCERRPIHLEFHCQYSCLI